MKSETTTQRTSWVLSLVFLAALVLALFNILVPFLVPVAWAALAVFITWPVNSYLQRRLPHRPALAALVMTVSLGAILVLAVVPLSAAFTAELQDLVQGMRAQVIEQGQGSIASIRDLPYLPESWKARLTPYLTKLMTGKDQLAKFAYEYQSQLLGAITAIATRAARFAFDFVVFLFASFYLYLHGAPLWSQVVRGFKKIGGERFERLLGAMQQTVKAAVYGTFVTAFAQGTLAGIGYMVAGAPMPILLGLLTMIFALIPFGPPLIYLSAAVIVGLQQSVFAGALLALWGLGVVSTVDNVLRPLFISHATRLPFILVLFGVLGGVLSMGLIGAFFGPALMAIAVALWNEWTAEPTQSTPSQLPAQ